MIKFWLKKVVTIDIVPMFFFLNYILLHSSTIFNLRVIVYKSELSFIYLLFLGHWVVTFLVLLYLDWDSHWTCLVGLCSCLLDETILSILSSKTCLVSLLAIYTGCGLIMERSGLDAEQHFRAFFPCCVNLGASPLLCDLGNM